MAIVARVPDLDRSRLRRLRGPLGAAGAVGVAALALHVRDPHQRSSWGICPFKALTGWDCPACGSLRAVNDLGHGQLAEAAHSNLLFVASIPLLVAVWALWTRRSWTGHSWRPPAGMVPPLAIACTVLMIAFTIYRNTPWGSAWYAG
jgi:hypothetical protein